MTEKETKNQEAGKVGNKVDPFSLDGLRRQAREMRIKLLPKKEKGELTGYPVQEIREGRPYYYLIWCGRDADGKRQKWKKYLGTSLPPGLKLGQSVKVREGK